VFVKYERLYIKGWYFAYASVSPTVKPYQNFLDSFDKPAIKCKNSMRNAHAFITVSVDTNLDKCYLLENISLYEK